MFSAPAERRHLRQRQTLLPQAQVPRAAALLICSVVPIRQLVMRQTCSAQRALATTALQPSSAVEEQQTFLEARARVTVLQTCSVEVETSPACLQLRPWLLQSRQLPPPPPLRQRSQRRLWPLAVPPICSGVPAQEAEEPLISSEEVAAVVPLICSEDLPRAVVQQTCLAGVCLHQVPPTCLLLHRLQCHLCLQLGPLKAVRLTCSADPVRVAAPRIYLEEAVPVVLMEQRVYLVGRVCPSRLLETPTPSAAVALQQTIHLALRRPLRFQLPLQHRSPPRLQQLISAVGEEHPPQELGVEGPMSPRCFDEPLDKTLVCRSLLCGKTVRCRCISVRAQC